MEKSFVFNSVNGDRRYKAEDFREYFASFISNGVFPNPSNNLQVIANNDMTITIKAGKGWINGAIYINTDDYILNIDVADGVLNRIDKVVLRMDTAERKIYSYVKKGQFASSPTAPTLQRDADAYEIALADVAVNKGAISITQANITDLRLDKNLCGIVHGTVDQIDVTTLFNQYSTRFKIKSEEFEKEFEDWLKTLKDVLGEDTAGNLLNLITKNTESINNIKSDLADITTLTGNKDNLKTINKTNLVSAINEVFTSGNNVKFNTVDALLQLDKSLQITKESKWEDIIKNISKVSTGKKWAKGKIDFQNEKLIYELKDLKFIPQNIFIFINMYGDNGRSDYDSWFASTEEFKFNLSQYARNNISNLNQYLINVKIENNGLIITIPNEFYSTPKGICIGGIYFFITE
ncbi:hypothetical protein [Clostridium botulinum]|uniref:hypothetical protein n=1 Tax=Clostridium botulinum TaxID=1491 RepID=UPI003EF193E7